MNRFGGPRRSPTDRPGQSEPKYGLTMNILFKLVAIKKDLKNKKPHRYEPNKNTQNRIDTNKKITRVVKSRGSNASFNLIN